MIFYYFIIVEIQCVLYDGELSVWEIVCQMLDDIVCVNLQINVWIEVIVQCMLVEVDSIDVLCWEKCFLLLLVGIFYVVKNLFDVVGYIIFVGVELLSGWLLVVSDSWVVCQLYSVGVLFSGMFNMDVYVYGFIIENSYYGVMCNLYDLLWIVGGFFGGLVVVVVVGLVYFSFGSDINGLICVFVLLCGIFGLKFIFGCFFCFGSYLFVVSLDYIGFFVCWVVDFVVVYDVLQGCDLVDDFQVDKVSECIGNLLDWELEGLCCVWLGGYFIIWCDDDVWVVVDWVVYVLGVDSELQFVDVVLVCLVVFIISVSEGGN